LRPGGRLSFVVPAEIGHAPYAGPLLDYLIGHFATVHVTAVRAKLFPDLSEDCWLLHAEGFGGRTDTIRLTIAERFTASARPPRATHRLSVSEWRLWNRRLRPFLIPQAVRELYQHSCAQPGSTRFGDAATSAAPTAFSTCGRPRRSAGRFPSGSFTPPCATGGRCRRAA
jgi:hypothetical protein